MTLPVESIIINMVALLEKKCELFRDFYSLCRSQTELTAKDDVNGLIELSSKRQEIIETIDRIDLELAPVLAEYFASGDTRYQDKVKPLLDELSSTIKDILETDVKNKQATAEKITRIKDQARQADMSAKGAISYLKNSTYEDEQTGFEARK